MAASVSSVALCCLYSSVCSLCGDEPPFSRPWSAGGRLLEAVDLAGSVVVEHKGNRIIYCALRCLASFELQKEDL